MTNAEAKTYRDELRTLNYRALDEQFEAGEMTALEYRQAESRIDAEYPE